MSLLLSGWRWSGKRWMRQRLRTRCSRKTCGESWPKGYSTFLLFVQFADPLEGIDLIRRFIRAQAHDTGKAQRVTAAMPCGLLDIIESHFDDDVGLDRPAKALIRDRVLQEILREPANFFVGQACKGLADIAQPVLAAHRKGEIGEYAVTFAVAVFY